MLVTTTTIARLSGHPPMWVRRHTLRGDFGPFRKGLRGALLVDLGEVEAYTGRKFTPEQLAAALGADQQPMETV